MNTLSFSDHLDYCNKRKSLIESSLIYGDSIDLPDGEKIFILTASYMNTGCSAFVCEYATEKELLLAGVNPDTLFFEAKQKKLKECTTLLIDRLSDPNPQDALEANAKLEYIKRLIMTCGAASEYEAYYTDCPENGNICITREEDSLYGSVYSCRIPNTRCETILLPRKIWNRHNQLAEHEFLLSIISPRYREFMKKHRQFREPYQTEMPEERSNPYVQKADSALFS